MEGLTLPITNFKKKHWPRRLLIGLMLWFGYLFATPLIFYRILPAFDFYKGLIFTLETASPLLNGDTLFLLFEAGIGTFLVFVPAVILWPIGVFDDK